MAEIEIEFEDEEYERIKEAAALQGQTVDEFICEALELMIKTHDPGYFDKEEEL